ncbi:hypothetical protein HanRHA438_Chr04g0166091 [Helianthus annuus]|uniref:Uncharacterized protein n=1 Tax=Helianthus annuus TaxID=4232 RepID=A0A9K3J7M7_HELAN|nr:hypothetical protein HanXRQr2_Chr04g0155931 [Helianthus annuus]KAJ0580344.1 hypothetical protein HanHA300_Chr04g0128151 [Helianthus annuus]KAJ0596292.1 hypothetical protein HanHA89_Chr04g0141111 [Helianthus annuus]KAJ0926005.1 hypothetical protein HanRHA438_Chr04g0166091 [Helianthus annuus]KAJ0930492.1 hypothetical protein HanPSC8_Chr04g0149941 [Helianthus annuus]
MRRVVYGQTRRYGGRLGPAWPGAGPPHRPPLPASVTNGDPQPGPPCLLLPFPLTYTYTYIHIYT